MTELPEDEVPARPVWLMTLADLALLLVGFFVFLQANQMDGKALAAGLRAGFGAQAETAMPVEMALVAGFAPGSAVPGNSDAAIGWARSAARDPRTRLNISGEVDGSPQDVDPQTGSGAILAADRAKAVAAMLVVAGAVSPARIRINTATGKRRTLLTLGFEGDRQ
jgi:flagellar motor protein MotB